MKLQKSKKTVKIKNPKEFDIKFNNFIKALAITTTLIFVSNMAISGMVIKKTKPTNKKPTISKEYNNFDKHIKTENGITYYKGENISIGINNDTLETKEYIVDLKTNKSDSIKEFNMYELETGEMIAYYKKGIILKIDGIGYCNYLSQNCEFYSLEEILSSIKNWYTLEEIKEIEEEYLKNNYSSKVLKKEK